MRKEQEARAESRYELWHMEDNIKEENKTVKVNDWLSLHTILSADNGRKG